MSIAITEKDVERWRKDLNLDPAQNIISQFPRITKEISQQTGLPDLAESLRCLSLSLEPKDQEPDQGASSSERSADRNTVVNPWTGKPLQKEPDPIFGPRSTLSFADILPPSTSDPAPTPSTSDSPSSSSTSAPVTHGSLFEYQKRAYTARDKEMATKEGRLKWEAYETRFRCVGQWEAQKKRAIEHALGQRIDYEEMLRLHEEQLREKAAAEVEAKKTTSKGKKGRK